MSRDLTIPNTMGRLMNDMAVAIRLLDNAARDLQPLTLPPKIAEAQARLEESLAMAEQAIFGDLESFKSEKGKTA